MYCTFYRPTKIDTKEFENIVGKLHYDLFLLENEKHDEWSVYGYFYNLSRQAEALPKNPAMRFIGLADPATMPSDAMWRTCHMRAFRGTSTWTYHLRLG